MSKGAELPDDCTALAVLVQDPRTPSATRDEAMRKLHLVIQRLARGVACSLMVPKQMRADLITEASSHVWERLATYDGRNGKAFTPWCRRVLLNLMMDRLRQARRTKDQSMTDLGATVLDGPCASNGFGNGATAAAIDVVLDRQEPFGAQDMVRIRGWKLRDRLVLLALANLSSKVPAEEWLEWVRDYGLDEPYPPVECLKTDSPAERVAMLASCCAMLPNTLAQLWHRKKSLLAELDYIRGLQGDL